MAELYVSFISTVAIIGVGVIFAAAGVVMAAPTAVAMFAKYEPSDEDVILVRAKAHDYDEDR